LVTKACKGAQALTILAKVKEAMETEGVPEPGKVEEERAAVAAVHAAAAKTAAASSTTRLVDPSDSSTLSAVLPQQQKQQQVLAAVEEWHALHGAAAAALVAAAEDALLQQQGVGTAAVAVATVQGSLVTHSSTGLPALVSFKVGEWCNELALSATNWRDPASIRLLLQKRVLPGFSSDVCLKPESKAAAGSEAQDEATAGAGADISERFGGAALTGAVLQGSSFKGFWGEGGGCQSQGDLLRCWW
jgi:hypothetical protein